MRPHHSGETQTTNALEVQATRKEFSSEIRAVITPGNYGKTEWTKPLNNDNSYEDSSPVMESPGLSGVNS